MRKWVEIVGACCALVATTSCRDGGRISIDECVEPTLLRVKVAGTILDLPNSVSGPHSISMDETRTSEKLGIIDLNRKQRKSNPNNRAECNGKTHPIADFRTDMEFVYRGDGAEPEDYRMGARMYSIVRIGKYDPKSAAIWRSNFLADVSNIENVRFLKRTMLPSNNQAIYEFAFEGRRFAITCQIWDDSKYGRDNPRPAFPNQCSPKMPFRAGDIVIAVDQRSWRRDGSGGYALIPPEQWPQQWAFTIGKILSFRVDND